MTDLEQARDVLNKIAHAVAAYLKPDGITAEEAMAQILELDSHPGWVATRPAED